MMNPRSTLHPLRSLFSVGMLLLIATGCGSRTETKLEPAARTVETQQFNAKRTKTADGKIIQVQAIPMGSGELTTEILEGRLQAHLVSPASSVFIELGNAESKVAAGRPLVGDTENLVLSPVVIAMWKPMAEALGWGQRPIGWSDILEMAQNDQGWSKYGFPQWGHFKFGHTHPEYSNSGIISLFAEVYAGAGKVRDLTLQDVQRPEVGQYLSDIEQSVVHYGSSTGFFGRKLFENGPAYLSAAVLYENMVIESYDAQYRLPFPVVAIYPKEGTFWSDHPVGIVDRDWVSAEHRAAAATYIDFLTDQPQQQRALEFGFRPGDPSIPVGSPIDAAHGVDPAEPKTTLEVPSAPVMKSVIDLWKKHKKHANVVLALDVSGSMEGDKLQAAKLGAEQLVDLLGDDDYLSLVSFNGNVAWSKRSLRMGDGREQARQIVNSLFANGGTAVYDAVHESHAYLLAEPKPGTIAAVVVLTDGADRNSRTGMAELIDEIRTDNEVRTVRVFTIGYGEDAEADVLERISDATQAKYYSGSTDNIREVFKEISTFF